MKTAERILIISSLIVFVKIKIGRIEVALRTHIDHGESCPVEACKLIKSKINVKRLDKKYTELKFT